VERAAGFIFNAKLQAYSVFFPFKNRLLTSWSISTLFCWWGNTPLVTRHSHWIFSHHRLEAKEWGGWKKPKIFLLFSVCT
jgi:hypothetical protein